MHRSHGLIAVAAIAALLSLGPGLGSSRTREEEPRNPPAGTIDQAGPRKLALLVGISQYAARRIRRGSPRTGGTSTARTMWTY